jgi:hypothetical protein
MTNRINHQYNHFYVGWKHCAEGKVELIASSNIASGGSRKKVTSLHPKKSWCIEDLENKAGHFFLP